MTLLKKSTLYTLMCCKHTYNKTTNALTAGPMKVKVLNEAAMC